MQTHHRLYPVLALLAFLCALQVNAQRNDDPLSYTFTRGYGQVEVGGPYAGFEFHESRPLPARISFFSPVANSIDLSTDYWKRGASRPMVLALQIDGRPPRWIGRDAWEYVLRPDDVTFHRNDDSLSYSVGYRFGMHEPLAVVRFVIVNHGAVAHRLDVYTHLKTALRTCQTYARFDTVTASYEEGTSAAVAVYDRPETADAAVIIENFGERPEGWMMDASALSVSDSGTSSWPGGQLPHGHLHGARVRGCSAFTYEKLVGPEDSLVIVLGIASCRAKEALDLVQRLPLRWDDDVAAYRRFVDSSGTRRPVLRTGDPWVDRSVLWSKALLAANAHFLDGSIVPMPCPAEYNFFFTHDMLLTDLAAVAFDAGRVKRDLLYLAAHAKDNIIPHAYYWRDDGFKTEYCAPDNWNHFWFILVSAAYLRHTMDSAMVAGLYPLLTTSINDALRQLHGDHLMYAGAPDWWDIGKNEGPRSYMTILAIRAVREYLFISSYLRKYSPRLEELERESSLMETALGKLLWDGHARYLMNVNSGKKDPHFYMGSLLAPVFHLLDSSRSASLVATAEHELLARGIGIRTAMPADFHTDSMRAWFHFVDNEAGDPYLYANGGVWPHNNAWYALALLSAGRREDAYRFYQSTMTLDGIAHSPMGQPAFYEYRFSDTASPEYGKIDKPSFLWAAGFTLLTGYHLLGFDETEWNLALAAPLPSALDTARCVYEFGGEKDVRLRRGNGALEADGRIIPSRVIPLTLRTTRSWENRDVGIDVPVLLSVNAIVHDVKFDSVHRRLVFTVSSFKGHAVVAKILGAGFPHHVTVDGSELRDIGVARRPGQQLVTQIRWKAKDGIQVATMQY